MSDDTKARLQDVITEYADDFLKLDHERMTRWPEVEEAIAAHERTAKAEAWDEGRDEALTGWHIDHTDPESHIDPNPYEAPNA